jgi:diguanylate cyclase
MLPLMMKHNVPVNPINYAIWYHYVSGGDADLNKTIDALIRDQKPFDADISLTLYKTHVCHASLESFEEINENLLQLTAQLSVSVHEAGEKASATENNFGDKLVELDSTTNVLGLKLVLAEIISQTRDLADTSKDLKNFLHNSDRQIVAVRNELANVREASISDNLTGLLNRSAFDKALNELIAKDPGQKTCLAILDIDHLGRVNDSFGHLVGDKLVKHVASLLKNQVPSHCQAARFSGAEMAVIMPDTTLAGAFHVIEQIRLTLEVSRLKYHEGTIDLGKVTLSAGIALHQATEGVNSLVTRAGQLLSLAKKTGGNKVLCEDKI